MSQRGLNRSLDGRGYHPVDLVIAGFLAFVVVLLLVSRTQLPGRMTLLGIHLVALAAVLALRFVPRDRPAWMRVWRDLYPLACLPLAYFDMKYLNRLATLEYFDAQVIRWEQALFGCQLSQELYNWLPNAAVSEFAHLAYLAYGSLIPTIALTLFFQHRRAQLHLFTTTVVSTFTFCYVFFITFPVLGPFHYLGPIDPHTKHSFIAVLTDRILHSGSSPGTAFPSSHVAVGMVVWGIGRRYLPRLSILTLVIAAGIFLGTVYGGFHYGVDALAGLAVGMLFIWLGPRLHRLLLNVLGGREQRRFSARPRPLPRASDPRRSGRLPVSDPVHGSSSDDGLDRRPASRDDEPAVAVAGGTPRSGVWSDRSASPPRRSVRGSR